MNTDKGNSAILCTLLLEEPTEYDLLSRFFLDNQLKTRYESMVEERARAIGYSHGKGRMR
jgi:hypothetical protein